MRTLKAITKQLNNIRNKNIIFSSKIYPFIIVKFAGQEDLNAKIQNAYDCMSKLLSASDSLINSIIKLEILEKEIKKVERQFKLNSN